MGRAIFKQIEVPMMQPDSCKECPFLGIIPKNERRTNSKECFVCLATCEAMTNYSVNLSASERPKKQPLKRWCDEKWEEWRKRGFLPIRQSDLTKYREPLDRSKPLVIKFHTRGETPYNTRKAVFSGGYFDGFTDEEE